jgi:hypothetical protein
MTKDDPPSSLVNSEDAQTHTFWHSPTETSAARGQRNVSCMSGLQATAVFEIDADLIAGADAASL